MTETDSASDIVPGTVFTERQVGILKKVVIALGVLLVGGFVLVIAVIVYQAMNPGESTQPARSATAPVAAPLVQGGLNLPKGAVISHMALDDNRLAVHLTGPAGEEIRIIDLGTGSVISTIRIKSE